MQVQTEKNRETVIKINSLKTIHRKEFTKVLESERFGADTDNTYLCTSQLAQNA